MRCLPGLKKKKKQGTTDSSSSSVSETATASKKYTKECRKMIGARKDRVILHGWLRSRTAQVSIVNQTGEKLKFGRWKTRYWRLLLRSDALVLQKSRSKTSDVYKSIKFNFGHCLVYQNWGISGDKEFHHGFTLRSGLDKQNDFVFEAAVRSLDARNAWFTLLNQAFGIHLRSSYINDCSIDTNHKSSMEIYESFYSWFRQRSQEYNQRSKDGDANQTTSASSSSSSSTISRTLYSSTPTKSTSIHSTHTTNSLDSCFEASKMSVIDMDVNNNISNINTQQHQQSSYCFAQAKHTPQISRALSSMGPSSGGTMSTVSSASSSTSSLSSAANTLYSYSERPFIYGLNEAAAESLSSVMCSSHPVQESYLSLERRNYTSNSNHSARFVYGSGGGGGSGSVRGQASAPMRGVIGTSRRKSINQWSLTVPVYGGPPSAPAPSAVASKTVGSYGVSQASSTESSLSSPVLNSCSVHPESGRLASASVSASLNNRCKPPLPRTGSLCSISAVSDVRAVSSVWDVLFDSSPERCDHQIE